MADTSWERELEQLDNFVQCTTAEVYVVVERMITFISEDQALC